MDEMLCLPMFRNTGFPCDPNEVVLQAHVKSVAALLNSATSVAPPGAPFDTHFRFLDLPSELRNQIYDLVFTEAEFQIHWLMHRKNLCYLTLLCPHTLNPARNAAMKQYREYLLRTVPKERTRHYQHDSENRRAARPDFQLDKFARCSRRIALLLTCRQVNEEANAIFYGKLAFHFVDAGVLNMFERSLRPSTRASIRRLRVLYEPRWSDGWVDVNDWSRVCRTVVEEFAGLEELNLQIGLHCNSWGGRYEDEETCDMWATPWMQFRGRGLQRVAIRSNRWGLGCGKVSTMSLKQEMLSSAGDVVEHTGEWPRIHNEDDIEREIVLDNDWPDHCCTKPQALQA